MLLFFKKEDLPFFPVSRSPMPPSTPWHLLTENPAEAEQYAVQNAGSDASAALLLGAARRRLCNLPGAREALAPLIAGPKAGAPEWFEWGMLQAAVGEDAAAVSALQQATARAPNFATAWWALADLHAAMGAGVAAGQAYARAARAGTTNPALIPAAEAIATGDAETAENLLRTHLQTHAADAPTVRLLAEAVMRGGRFGEAEAMLTDCISAAPAFTDARHSLGALHFARRKFRDATPHLRHVQQSDPYNPILRRLTALACIESGDYDSALPLIESLLQAAPNQAELWLRQAHALKTLGRSVQAASAYRTCIELAPQWRAGAWLSLADMKTTRFTDEEISAIRAAIADPRTTQDDAARLHYALGAALEQRADYAAAFGAFSNGGALRRRAIVYDADTISAYVTTARATFTADFFAARAEGGNPSTAPIFVVGLPRAGSSLVEQILASHSDVEGAGELEALGQLALELRGVSPLADLPSIIAALDAPTRTQLGTRYLEAAAQHRTTGAVHFIDKMPANALLVPLIALILPNARIIDIRRPPMAAGLAAFQQYFQPRQNTADYTYTLPEIARYIRDYTALMSHLQSALPNRVHHLSYEHLVTETETQIRTLLDYCALPFEAAFLNCWQTSSPVQTPSAQQLRQPIFTTGLTHWRRCAPYLAELRVGLGDLAED